MARVEAMKQEGFDLALLMALRVQGRASLSRLAAALGSSEEAARTSTQPLINAGLATFDEGRLPGYSLTKMGLSALEAAVTEEGFAGDPELAKLYDRFLELNQELLRVASDWQVRRYGGAEIVNAHDDPSYDRAVIRRLSDLNAKATIVIREIGQRVPRLVLYGSRLSSCVERVKSGDIAAFTAPLAESYHTVWFELHQDLILTLGVEREA